MPRVQDTVGPPLWRPTHAHPRGQARHGTSGPCPAREAAPRASATRAPFALGHPRHRAGASHTPQGRGQRLGGVSETGRGGRGCRGLRRARPGPAPPARTKRGFFTAAGGRTAPPLPASRQRPPPGRKRPHISMTEAALMGHGGGRRPAGCWGPGPGRRLPARAAPRGRSAEGYGGCLSERCGAFAVRRDASGGGWDRLGRWSGVVGRFWAVLAPVSSLPSVSHCPGVAPRASQPDFATPLRAVRSSSPRPGHCCETEPKRAFCRVFLLPLFFKMFHSTALSFGLFVWVVYRWGFFKCTATAFFLFCLFFSFCALQNSQKYLESCNESCQL